MLLDEGDNPPTASGRSHGRHLPSKRQDALAPRFIPDDCAVVGKINQLMAASLGVPLSRSRFPVKLHAEKDAPLPSSPTGACPARSASTRSRAVSITSLAGDRLVSPDA